jgi:hypothetical protein
MDAGLFEPFLTEEDSPKDRHREIFSLDGGLSRGERLLIQSAAFDILAPMEVDEPFRYEKLTAEFERFAQCGNEYLPLDCGMCNTAHYVPIRCRSRLCEDCNKAWAKNIESQLVPEIGKLNAHKRRGYVLAHAVLTVGKWWGEDRMPNPDEIKQFARWCSDFTRLHYGKFVGAWSKSGKVVERRKRFQGGAWVRVLEFGLDNNNLHAHLIVYGPIKPKQVLDASWGRITGNRGRWVWIEKLRRTKQAVAYVMKYLVKPPVSLAYQNLAGYAISIKGTRRLATGGLLYNRVKSKIDSLDRPRCSCTVCGSRLVPGRPGAMHKVGSRVDLWPALWDLSRSGADEKRAKALLLQFLPAGVTPMPRKQLPLFCN